MNRNVLAIALVCLFALTGCPKKNKGHDHKGHDHKGHKHNTRSTPRKAAKPATRAKAPKQDLTSQYEVVRKALAADDLKATLAGAKALGAWAATMKTSPQAKTYTEIAAAAKKLAATKDFAAARLAFGDLSKHTITLLTATKQTKGLTAYSCPMAKGYKKWLQADNDMANPYMGKRMLKCGGKTALTP